VRTLPGGLVEKAGSHAEIVGRDLAFTVVPRLGATQAHLARPLVSGLRFKRQEAGLKRFAVFGAGRGQSPNMEAKTTSHAVSGSGVRANLREPAAALWALQFHVECGLFLPAIGQLTRMPCKALAFGAGELVLPGYLFHFK
jgi:hypothetical protein